jgi:hypothetical protein
MRCPERASKSVAIFLGFQKAMHTCRAEHMPTAVNMFRKYLRLTLRH